MHVMFKSVMVMVMCGDACICVVLEARSCIVDVSALCVVLKVQCVCCGCLCVVVEARLSKPGVGSPLVSMCARCAYSVHSIVHTMCTVLLM